LTELVKTTVMDVKDGHKGIRIRGVTIRIKEFKSDYSGIPEYRIVFEFPNGKQLEKSNIGSAYASFNEIAESIIETGVGRKPKYRDGKETKGWHSSTSITTYQMETVTENGMPLRINKELNSDKSVIDVAQTIDPLEIKKIIEEEIKKKEAEKINKGTKEQPQGIA
jgi:hypothetical protein